MVSRSHITRFVAGTVVLGVVGVGPVATLPAASAAPAPVAAAVAAPYGPKVTVNAAYNRNSRQLTISLGRGSGKPRGAVKVKVGGRSYTLTLRGGKAMIKLPKNLPAGRYKVTVTYRGADGKMRTVTTTIYVTKKKGGKGQASFNSPIPGQGKGHGKGHGTKNGSGNASGRGNGDGQGAAFASGGGSGGSTGAGSGVGANRAAVSGAVDSGIVGVTGSGASESATLADTGATTQTELLALVGLGLLAAGGSSIVVARRRSRVRPT